MKVRQTLAAAATPLLLLLIITNAIIAKGEATPKIARCLNQSLDESSHVSRFAIKYKYGGNIPKDHDDLLDETCLPDTLYTWMPAERINWFRSDGAETITSKSSPIFAWRTPLGSFGYGNLALRIKLKPQTKFKVVQDNNCGFDSAVETENTVYLRSEDWPDYVICSMKVIESFSFGRQEEFKEMIEEREWITIHKNSDYSLYVNLLFSKDWLYHFTCDRKVSSCVVDKWTDFSQVHFDDVFKVMSEYVKGSKSEVWMNRGLEPSGKPAFRITFDKNEIARHFSTNKPDFFYFR